LAGDAVVGYIAGHRTTRHHCAGEVQYLFVAPAYRRRGVATALLGLSELPALMRRRAPRESGRRSYWRTCPKSAPRSSSRTTGAAT
jgi:GNAT superfamily N-acetyltransferase